MISIFLWPTMYKDPGGCISWTKTKDHRNMETSGEKRTHYKIKIQGPSAHFTDLWNSDIRIRNFKKDETLLECQLVHPAELRSL